MGASPACSRTGSSAADSSLWLDRGLSAYSGTDNQRCDQTDAKVSGKSGVSRLPCGRIPGDDCSTSSLLVRAEADSDSPPPWCLGDDGFVLERDADSGVRIADFNCSNLSSDAERYANRRLGGAAPELSTMRRRLVVRLTFDRPGQPYRMRVEAVKREAKVLTTGVVGV